MESVDLGDGGGRSMRADAATWRRTWLECAAAALAGLAAVGALRFVLVQPFARGLTFADPGWRPATAALALLVAATALATVVPARVRGWPTTALGLVVLFITAVAYSAAGWPYVNLDRMSIIVRFAAAVAAGLVVGGVLAARSGPPAARTAVLASFAGGIVVLPGVWGLPAVGPPTAGLFVVGAILAVLAAVLAPTTPPQERPGPAVTVAVTAALVYLGEVFRARMVYEFLHPGPSISERRMRAVEIVNAYAYLALALGAALILLWYALSSGGPAAGRWTAVGIGLGLPLAVASYALVGRTAPAIVSGLAGVAAGAVLTRHAGRRQPWAGLGLLTCAVALVLLAGVQVLGSTTLMATGTPVLLGFGLGFALSSGLAVSIGAPSTPDGVRHTPAGRALLGLAGALLVGHLLMPSFGLPLAGGDRFPPPLGGILFVVVAAFVELVLFGLERWTGRRSAPVRMTGD